MKNSIKAKTVLSAILGLLILNSVVTNRLSAESDPIVLFEDSFNRTELGDPWRILVPSFSIEDGRLIGREVPERNHTTISRVPLDFRNGVFEFSFRLTDAKSLHFVMNDTNCEEAHAGHICRVSFMGDAVRISDDRDGAFRKDLYQAFIKSGRTSKRIFRNAHIPFTFDSEKWYKVRLNLIGDQLEVIVDGESIGKFTSPGIGHPTKTDFGFVTKGNIVEMDDVRVSKVE